MKQAYMPTEGQNLLEWALNKRDNELVMALRPSTMPDTVIDPTHLPLPRKKGPLESCSSCSPMHMEKCIQDTQGGNHGGGGDVRIPLLEGPAQLWRLRSAPRLQRPAPLSLPQLQRAACLRPHLSVGRQGKLALARGNQMYTSLLKSVVRDRHTGS